MWTLNMLNHRLVGELDRLMVDEFRLGDWQFGDGKYLYKVDLPGVSKDMLSVEVVDSKVHFTTIKGRHGAVEDYIDLPPDGDIASLTATLVDGVLTLTLAKVEPKAIKIKVS